MKASLTFSFVFMLLLTGCGERERESDTSEALEVERELLSDTQEDEVSMSMAGSVKEADTGFPFYPDAIQTASGAMSEDVAFVNLLTSDSPEEVKAFYDQKLSDYTWHADYELYSKDADAMTTFNNMNAYLSISEAGQEAADVIALDEEVKKDLKTRIQIVYRQ